jgi:hypothetical protein
MTWQSVAVLSPGEMGAVIRSWISHAWIHSLACPQAVGPVACMAIQPYKRIPWPGIARSSPVTSLPSW